MKFLLISKTPIIIQISQLIANKLELDFLVQDNLNISEIYDILLIDEEFIKQNFNSIKQYSKKLGAISSDKLSFDKASDFEITRPFLPKQLNDILLEQIELIKIQKNDNINTNTNEINIEKDESLVDVNDLAMYVESLADDILEDINDENDESIVSLASMNNGGVLDSNELSRINDILLEQNIQDEKTLEVDDWKDLSDIIDDALTSVQDYEFTDNNTSLELILSEYSIKELKPLFSKVDDSILEKLRNGEIIDIRLSLKVNND